MKFLKNLFRAPSPRLRLRRTLSDTLQYSIELTHQIEVLQIEAGELREHVAYLQKAIAAADATAAAGTQFGRQGVDTAVSAG